MPFYAFTDWSSRISSKLARCVCHSNRYTDTPCQSRLISTTFLTLKLTSAYLRKTCHSILLLVNNRFSINYTVRNSSMAAWLIQRKETSTDITQSHLKSQSMYCSTRITLYTCWIPWAICSLCKIGRIALAFWIATPDTSSTFHSHRASLTRRRHIIAGVSNGGTWNIMV